MFDLRKVKKKGKRQNCFAGINQEEQVKKEKYMDIEVCNFKEVLMIVDIPESGDFFFQTIL